MPKQTIYQEAKKDYIRIMRGKWNGKTFQQLNSAAHLIFDKKLLPLYNYPEAILLIREQIDMFISLIPWFFPKAPDKHKELMEFIKGRCEKIVNRAREDK